jgi:hypothetical protein
MDSKSESSLCALATYSQAKASFSNVSPPGSAGFCFYPLAFNTQYGNFTARVPPDFLAQGVLNIVQDNIDYQHQNSNVLSYGHFQAYSDIKKCYRFRPENLLASKGLATAALTLPKELAKSSAVVRKRQTQILERHLRSSPGSADDDNRLAQKPFAREREQVTLAIRNQEYAYRVEQVFNIDATKLAQTKRTFREVLRPALHFIHFFLTQSSTFEHLLRVFDPMIFPRVLISFARIIEVITDKLLARFDANDAAGLNFALSEGLSALDRLGNYCFTGNACSLSSRIFAHFGTTQSLLQCGWPYINPAILDLRPSHGYLNLQGWPQNASSRPYLLHVAALEYYYTKQVAEQRIYSIWLQDLQVKRVTNLRSAIEFLTDVVTHTWLPQMTLWLFKQAERTVKSDSYFQKHNAATVAADLHALEAWRDSSHPFLQA